MVQSPIYNTTGKEDMVYQQDRFPRKTKNNKTTTTGEHQNWVMGLLFILSTEEEEEENSGITAASSIINNKKKHQNILNLFSSSSPSSTLPIFKRANSAHLRSRTQYTISICAFLIFVTLLLFTLSTFEPSSHFASPRILLYETSSSPNPYNYGNKYNKKFKNPSLLNTHALQGMGTLYRRGTKAMKDLVVAHVSESLNLHELRLFLRLLHRSSLPSRSDLLFIFPSKKLASNFDSTILEENDSFLQLLDQYQKLNNSTGNLIMAPFVESSKKDKESRDPIWGRRTRSNFSEGEETESIRLSYGSAVGFDVDELDPENSLAGFLDHVPMSLRRWACYPLLLGRVRRNFKHIMLVDVKELLLTGDPFSRVRTSSRDSVHLLMVTQSITTRHGKKNSDKTQVSVNPAIIRGGMRGIRRLSNAMLTEIVRAETQRKKKNPVTESGLFNQLVGNEFLLKNINLIKSTESVPELSSLAGQLKPGSSSSSIANFSVVRRGNNNFDVNSTVLKHVLCSSPLDSSVYSNCL